MNITIGQAKKIIKILRDRQGSNTFTSHDFIGGYIKNYEGIYICMLNKYKRKKTKKVFQTVNAQIARFLSLNHSELNISKTAKVKDMNVHNKVSPNQGWKL